MVKLEEAAQGGSHFAAYRLGTECLTGEVVQKDAPKAVEWFAQSAAADNQYAQYMGQAVPDEAGSFL